MDDSPPEAMADPPAAWVYDGRVAVVPLERIDFNPAQPRPEAEDDELAGLAGSLGPDPARPELAQLPALQPLAGGRYLLRIGERRVRAALRRGAPALQCLILRPDLPPATLFRLALAENLHRRPLHPIHLAAALRAQWLLDNAAALGRGDEAAALLEARRPLEALPRLAALLATAGWRRNAPAVTLRDSLATAVGVDISVKKALRQCSVLALEELLPRAAELPLTEAAVRALAQLDPADQRALVAAVEADPDLARKVRSVAADVDAGRYSLPEALAVARGEVYLPGAGDAPAADGAAPGPVPWDADEPPPGRPAGAAPPDRADAAASDRDVALGEAVLEVLTVAEEALEASGRLGAGLGRLRAALAAGGGDAWAEYVETIGGKVATLRATVGALAPPRPGGEGAR